MAKGDDDGSVYVFTHDAVRRAVKKLAGTRSHEHIPGYLAIVGATLGSEKAAVPADILAFYEDYLRVQDAPADAPYLRPFKSRGLGTKRVMMNPNVAGSYAPRSLRSGALLAAVDVTGSKTNAKYRLRPNHADAVASSLLKDNPIPAASLMVFLLRDYGFRLTEPSIENAFALFRKRFRLDFEDDAVSPLYPTVFTDDIGSYNDGDLAPFAEGVDG